MADAASEYLLPGEKDIVDQTEAEHVETEHLLAMSVAVMISLNIISLR